jgi:glycosyltransferase involved in cell wall biosynthesis
MISIIIPTLGTRELELKRLFVSLSEQTHQEFEVILVSQGNHELVERIVESYDFTIKLIKLSKKGLSHSRNVGMKYVSGNIVTFSDDDCWYKNTAFEEVVEHFQTTDDHIVCYQIYDPERNEYYKAYPEEPCKHISIQDIFRKSSIEIFIDLDKVDKKMISFHEQFGLGATYPSGEENIFLYKMHKNKHRISYIPEVVVYHKKPSIDSRLNFNTFIGKGPLFKQMFNTPVGFVLLTLLFAKKFFLLERPFVLYFSAVKELFRYKKYEV